jgi:3-oxoacyl-[acyl-carrier protein] reductase
MSKKVENKVVIVTGASKGIGAGIAKQMGLEGAKVVVNYVTSKADADKVVNEITKAGGTAIAIKADMTKVTDVQRLFADTIIAFKKLDVLVNNAGIYEFATLEGSTEESYRRQFDINVLGVLLASQEAIKLFTAKGGSIINISSFASKNPEPYSLVYAATKAAVSSFTTSLSQELGPKNIRVNSILPGGVLTEGVAKLGLSNDAEDPIVKQMISRTALGRMGTPEDIGKLAVFLASDEAYFVTGQEIDISGGFK